ncbi:glycosyl hydrolase family 79 C-terminal domain-containing protein [Kutzneria viridogrisea]|uniref:Beta-glucuronidase C-terminal domain-containing protein n=2 Tax=Kutzneria TaxID=43356 RepID=W5W4K4_9PSEU|nr:hypothetical protein [Kutzneria albida]AHH95700.1 hypothetical protein KALB_2332 [Kutzneria albida DSM 43870]MBA8926935.1 hypothetical protein [Kutzneria viridogrisea]
MIRFPALLGCLAVVLGCLTAPAAQAAAPTVTVNPAGSGHVGQGFAGFSYEKDRVGAGMFDAADADLVRLFRLLGPSVLRIGGNLVDIVNWNPKGAGGSATEVARPDVVRLAAFLRATGWQVIYGINLKTNTPANAADEAQFAARTLGSSLLAFEIGNEPNFYRTEQTYEQSYEDYVGAIRAKVPGARFDGPGVTNGHSAWLAPFTAKEKDNGLAVLTMHSYIGDQTTGTIPGMLASNGSGVFSKDQEALRDAKAAGHIPQWRMSEANSYYHGGTAGVSNVQAAALWTLDFMRGIAARDGDGVNFHGGTSTQFPLNYSPIVYSGLTPTGVQGVYYGELLWRLAGTGALHAATVSGAADLTAWGIGNNLVLNNKGTSAQTLTVTLSSRAATAAEYVLTAPALNSTAITIAGSGVDQHGSFHPTPNSLRVHGKTLSVTVPAGSATLLVTS